MKENRIRKLLNDGKVVFGTMLQELRTPAVPILLANIGYDFFFIDMEHGAFNMETVADLIKMARFAGIVPFVRVPDLQYHLIARVFDAGAQGVMVPRVETREEAEKIVRYAKYPPLGVRGCSVNKGHNDYQSEEVLGFVRRANEENFLIVQIERKRAVEDIDSILSVPGIDGAILGPNDLAVSLGVPNDLDSEIMHGSIAKVVESGRKNGVFVGMHIPHLEKLCYWMSEGMSIITYQTDLGLLKKSFSDGLKVLREEYAKLRG